MKNRLTALSLAALGLAAIAPAFAGIIFDDGPTNGTSSALFIDGPNPGPFNQWIVDTFTATGSGTVSELDFGLWVATGTTPTTVTWWLGTTFLDNSIGGGTVSLTAADYSLLTTGGGFDVYEVKLTGLSSSLLSAGSTYSLTLGNANDSGGTQFDAWDINGGPAVCTFGQGSPPPVGGCGAGGEAFTLFSSAAVVPEPGSLILVATAIIGLAGVNRRKI